MSSSGGGAADGSVFAQAAAVRGDLTWERVRQMEHPVAAELVALEMSAHARFRTARRAWLLAAAVPVVVAALTGHGPVAVLSGLAAAVAAVATPRLAQLRHYGAAHALLASQVVPTGRLHVLTVALVAEPPGGVSWRMFALLLRHGHTELSCTALGRHVDGLCPHRRSDRPQP